MNGSPRNSRPHHPHPPQYHSDRKPAMMPRRTAFTLLELLVVIAIMFGLITIAVVSFSGVRAVANRTASLNALRQMAAGFNSYASDHSGRFLPGYVAEAEMATLSPNVRDHEPTIALTPGGDGFGFYRVIASGAAGILVPGGIVLVEIGAGQRNGVASIFTEGSAFTHTGTFRAPNDPHDRVMQFTKV